jgi:hypothetical protein
MKDKLTIEIHFGYGVMRDTVRKTISIFGLSDEAVDRKINRTVEDESANRRSYPTGWQVFRALTSRR